ncbi:response regulator transcription factor [Rurimicrobium arvi]|uniref:Response regulator transcription factor n=1 Tax=Rurimicrobium arvi TaxID=2049916 RepID=A0ABP8MHH4_9BACT
MSIIRIAVIEDNSYHQEFISSIINKESTLDCVAVIDNGLEAVFRIPDLAPDIVLVDLGLPNIDGADCIAQLAPLCPDTKFMALTVKQDDKHIFKALQAGAKGYILKRSTPAQIIQAIHDIYRGGAPISSEIAIKILDHIPSLKKRTGNLYDSITKREHEILEHLSEGLTYDEISTKLEISINTFKSHIYRIYTKLSADNRTEALLKYFGNSRM